MDFSSYLDQIVFWIGSAIACLGGTSVTLGILFKSISNIVKGLKGNINGYDEQIEKIQSVGKSLETTGDIIVSIGTRIEDLTKQLEEQKTLNEKLSKDYKENMEKVSCDYKKLQEILYILAHNNSELASSGALEKIDKLLDYEKEDIVTTNEV